MFKPVVVDGIAVGQSPTALAAAIVAKPCGMCAAVAVLRSLSGAPEKAKRLKRALYRAGLGAHTCTTEA